MVAETASATGFALHAGGKMRRSSFKSRGGGVVSVGGVSVGGVTTAAGNGVRGYQAVRVTVPSTVVAELASKFNAVVVDADRGDTARDIIKKVNKTLAKGAAVRATVEKFESAAEKRHGGAGNVVVVRTNSDINQHHHHNHHHHHHHQHHAVHRTAVPPKSPPPASIVKRRMEQFQNGKKPQKPGVLGPKPKVTAAACGGQRRAMQKDVAAEVDCRRLLNKHKRLSIARDPDARLESVLNATPTPGETAEPVQLTAETERRPVETEQRPAGTEQRATETEQRPVKTEQEQRTCAQPPAIRPKPNSSFLHGRKRRTTADEGAEPRPTVAAGTTASTATTTTTTGTTSTSFLHDDRYNGRKVGRDDGDDEDGARPQHDYNYIDHCGGATRRPSTPPQAAIYEELLCDIQRSAAAASAAPDPSPLPDVVPADGSSAYYDDHYATIGDGEQNIYDDVVLLPGTTAAADRENRKRPAEEDGSYETVEAPPPPLPPVPQPPQQQQQQQTVPPAAPLPPLPVHEDGDRDGRYDGGDVDDEDDEDGRLEKKSDVSVEIDNSIYGMNPPSESTSSGVTSDSVSADRNSKFDLDEEWVDVDNTSDELQEIIVFRQKPKMNDSIAKGWSIQVQKQLTKAYVSISSQSVISFVKDAPEQVNRKKNPRDFPCGQPSSVVLKTVFHEEKFESQELSLFFDNEIEKTNTISQEIPEEIYADYDSFDSDDSWDDCRNREKVNRVPYPCENRDLPAPPSQQNIYGLVPLVKRAGNRMKKRWSFGSLGLNRIRKLSVGNLTSDFGLKTFDTASEKSVEKKFNPTANSLSSSIFYLNDPIYNNIENNEIRAPVRNTSRPPSSVDSRRLSVARPSSPPPPPPVKRHSTGSNAYGSLPRSICNSKGRPVSLLDRNNAELTSENGSNQGSDHLYMRFADEPLYQFYAADISERTKSVFTGDMIEECDGYEEISSITSRPSALELITPCLTGHGQHRSLWCEVPEVKNSGIIDTLNPRERKLQEAKFELITSEASYFKSLTVLEKHFVNSHSMNDETILSKNDRKILFGNVNPVRKCSEKLLAVLEKCWQDDILLKGLSEILYNHSKENFEIFVKYCSNQIYIDRTLKSLRDKNLKFNEALHRLESDPKCQSLSLHSFLMLPMQRITRLPLLVDAILSQMDSEENSLEYQMCELTLASLNTIVQNCNESTRKLERYEEMLLLSQQLEFSSKREMKAMSVASSSRWLVRSGSMLHLTSPDAKLTLSRKFVRPTKLYFFLFNDMFFIAKRKSDENYTVVDYCARNFLQMVDATELVITSSYKNLLMLTILENHEGKTIEMLLSCDSESSKKRWIEAMSPPISSNPDETLYNEWDCPQVFVEHAYTAIQPDELSLQNGDIVKVLTKMNDGWYHGERIRDGEKGWFPGNYTSEIASQHARAKNLKQRYRLLAMSGSYLQSQQDKIKKK